MGPKLRPKVVPKRRDGESSKETSQRTYERKQTKSKRTQSSVQGRERSPSRSPSRSTSRSPSREPSVEILRNANGSQRKRVRTSGSRLAHKRGARSHILSLSRKLTGLRGARTNNTEMEESEIKYLHIIEGLERTQELVTASPNEMLINEFKEQTYELGRYMRSLVHASSEVKERIAKEHAHYTNACQSYIDQQKHKERNLNQLPRELGIDFNGSNPKAFWSWFTASCIHNPALSDIEKYRRLLQGVRKDDNARRLVSGFESDGSQLDACLKAFVKRYLDPEHLKADSLRKVHELPALTSLLDPLALSKFVNELRNIQTSLLGHVHESDNTHYLQVMQQICCKIPKEQVQMFVVEFHRRIKLNLKSKTPEDALSMLEGLILYLHEYESTAKTMHLLYGCGSPKKSDSAPRKRASEDKSSRHKKPRTDSKSTPKVSTNFVTLKNESATSNSMPELIPTDKCAICKDNHSTHACTKFDRRQRMNILRDHSICLRCVKHKYAKEYQCMKKCARCDHLGHHESNCYKTAEVVLVTMSKEMDRVVCLSALKAQISNGPKTHKVNVLFDAAATTSLIRSDSVSRVNAPIFAANETFLAGVTDGYRRTNKVACFSLSSLDGSFQKEVCAYITPEISSERIRPPSKRMQEVAQQANIPLTSQSSEPEVIDILIGQDILFAFLTNVIVPLGPLIGAFKSKLGWYIAGNEFGIEEGPEKIVQSEQAKSPLRDCDICQDLRLIFDINDRDDEEDIKAWEDFEGNIFYDERAQRYTVRLPKRAGIDHLPNNYFNALSQAETLKRRLMARDEFEEYSQVIGEYVTNGYAERVESPLVRSGVYLIPHHGVRKKDADKTKLRVVFNASSAVRNKKSLNDYLSKGVSINADIWGVSLKLRLTPIVLFSDMVKAFSQIKVHEEDRDFLRYLWYDSAKASHPKMYRMTSVIFGANCSPSLLGSVIKSHGKRFHQEYPRVTEQLDDSLFMDDGVFGARTVEDAKAILDEAQGFFQRASFQLHPWVTNNSEVRKTSHEFADHNKLHKCLGFLWDPANDTISIKPCDPAPSVITKRNAVSVLSQFYDPLNWYLPLKTRTRLFMRQLSEAQLGWDDNLTESQSAKLRQLVKEIDKVTQVPIPRTIIIPLPHTLHVFCDASQQAYGAVAYLVSNDNSQRLLICSKGKLAPKDKKNATIPRLELLAALIGARLCNDLLNRMTKDTQVALYSDSQVTLDRLNLDPNTQKPFEMRRLTMIHEVSTTDHWHYIPTADNPADILTRDKRLSQWHDDALWWNGPTQDLSNLAKPMPQERRSPCFLINAVELNDEERRLLSSSFTDAMNSLISQLREKETNDEGFLERENEGKRNPLSLERYAQMQLWKLVQADLFPEDVTRLTKGLTLSSSSRLRNLRPFLDEWGLLRTVRLAQPPELTWEAHNPLLIASHSMTKSYIRAEHQRLLHNSIAAFRNHLNNYFHLIRARRVIRSIISSCIECNRQRGRPFNAPEPTLPSFRTATTSRPFANVGLDYIGPIRTRNGKKIYALLFTCAVTRAVHLELVTELTTKGCIFALIRFFGRRGVPDEIHSDNAMTFKGASRCLRTMSRLIREAAPQINADNNFSIDWYFQVPRAPWWGGFFERLVKVVKDTLQQTRLRRVFDLEEVMTIFCQVEAIVNSRPLVEATEEGIPALTPAHFLVGHALTDIVPFPGRASDFSDSEAVLRDYVGFRSVQDAFWKRLRDEYILNLRRHHQQAIPSREPQLGELVAVMGEQKEGHDRMDWPMARIKKLIPGNDGVIRTVEIEMNGKTYTRAIQRLVPLEATRSVPPPGEDVAIYHQEDRQ